VNEPIRILFDENFGEPLVSALADFLAWYHEPLEVRHLFQFAEESETDDVWIPRIAPAGWTVITTDRAKQSGARKLPQLCCEYGVTHILISQSIHNSKQFEKVRAVVAMWPEIVAASLGPKGRRFSLRYDGPHRHVVLVECALPQSRGTRISVMPFSTRRKRSGGHAGRKRKVRPDVPGQLKMPWNHNG